ESPEWVAVKGGFLGMKRRLVPIDGATVHGDHVHLAFTKEQLEAAPDVDSGFADESDERSIYGYYGLDYPGQSFPYGDTAFADGADDSVVRHEEEVDVDTRTVNAGTVRLRKWVETQPVQRDVTLTRETARIEREPINEVVDAGAIGEDEVAVDLTREEAVVSKATVAKERVRLGTNVETETERVTDSVRKEHVELDPDSATDTY
ncbi:MAG: hypothetical protein JWN41_1394, partial [Thermoleophilia bacterium]|nr:hypothetical protein [Thermoleophilia bacterium]